MKSCSQLFAMSFLALALESAHGQGTIIPLHSGYNDPATEGFSLSLASASVGAVTNDLGMDAWTTAVPANGLYATYTKKLAPQQTEEMSGQNWVLSLMLRVVAMDTTGRSSVIFGDGTHAYYIFFGAANNGDPFVRIGNQSYSLNGAGSSYNNYELVSDAGSGTADLWVNGVERLSDVAHGLSAVGYLDFGSGLQSGPAQVNWNLISLEIVPEPSSAAFLLLGSGVLAFTRKRKSRR